jgi:hypothetical protein
MKDEKKMNPRCLACAYRNRASAARVKNPALLKRRGTAGP